MAATKLNHYSEVQAFIAGVLTANGESAAGAPHKDFWSTMTYTEFTTGNVPKVVDPVTKKPMPILIISNSGASNIIMALRGTPGTPFDPNTGKFGQMPADGPPMFTNDQIKSIADWIDAKCPE